MSIEELEEKLQLKLVKDNWSQHKNGGGWVHKEAQIKNKTVFIGENAVVWGGIIRGGDIHGGTIHGGKILGGMIFGGDIYGGIVQDGVIKGGEIRGGVIKGGLILGGKILGGTFLEGTLKGGTIIEPMIIEGGEWESTPLFIHGSKFDLTNSKPGHIAINCQTHSFDFWSSPERFTLANTHNLTDAEKIECDEYIALFKKIGK